jgi:hypothetical protein
MSNTRRQFLKSAEQLGFMFTGLTGRGHLRLHNPDIGVHYYAAYSPSDWRSHRNAIAAMQRLSGRKLAPNGQKGRR